MSTDYFHCQDHYLALPGVLRVRSGPYDFALPPTEFRDELAGRIADADAMIRDGNRAKTSVESSASIATLSGGRKVFVKRNGNRGFYFTVKYSFVPARVFRAAMAAVRVHESGIDTPRVLAVGEKRRFRVLLGGYLITDAVEDAQDLMALTEHSPDAPGEMPAILDDTARVVATLHGHGFYHGDLKLINLYRAGGNGRPGVWDLDSAQIFDGEVPRELVVRELGRIVSSVLICAERNEAFPDVFFDLGAVTDRLLSAYASHGGTPPAADEVAAMARTRWLNKRKLRFDYGARQS